jgi:hypothetical protein
MNGVWLKALGLDIDRYQSGQAMWELVKALEEKNATP